MKMLKNRKKKYYHLIRYIYKMMMQKMNKKSSQRKLLLKTKSLLNKISRLQTLLTIIQSQLKYKRCKVKKEMDQSSYLLGLMNL